MSWELIVAIVMVIGIMLLSVWGLIRFFWGSRQNAGQTTTGTTGASSSRPSATALAVGVPAYFLVFLPLLLFLFVVLTRMIGCAIPDRPLHADDYQDDPEARMSVPRELTDTEKELVTHQCLSELTSNRWKLSESEQTWDSSRPAPYILNMVYLDWLEHRIVAGPTNISRAKWQAVYNGRWNWVRTHDFDRFTMEPAAVLRARMADPGYTLQVHWSAKRNQDNALVLRSEAILAENEIRRWGPIPTKLDKGQLKADYTIVFLDREGRYLTNFTRETAPRVWITSAAELVPEDGTLCYSAIKTGNISHKNPQNDVLFVTMPTGGICLVNWKIDGIIE